jgi:hypothetical protein
MYDPATLYRHVTHTRLKEPRRRERRGLLANIAMRGMCVRKEGSGRRMRGR